MAAIESNQRSAGLKNPTLPFRGVEQEYPLPKELMMFHASLYFGLMVLLLLIGLVVTFGYGTISRMIGIAGRAAL
jgi:hypothetical protein